MKEERVLIEGAMLDVKGESMRRFVRGVKISGFCICVVASLWAVHSFTTRFFRVDRFLVQSDSAFSKAQKTAIADFIQNDQTLKMASLAVVAQRIQKRFPSIKKVSLVQDASGAIRAHADSVRPTFRINDYLVLSDDGCLFKKVLFSRFVLNSLDSVDVQNLEQRCNDFVDMERDEFVGTFLPQLFKTVQEIPSELFQQYRVSCRDKACWSLEDKQQKKFLIFFNDTKMPNSTVISACNKIKGTLDARGAFTGRRACTWVADARFEDQIILFRKTGGR